MKTSTEVIGGGVHRLALGASMACGSMLRALALAAGVQVGGVQSTAASSTGWRWAAG